MIFLKSFSAKKTGGKSGYSHSFSLKNEGIEQFRTYCFYSNDEEKINSFVNSINKISEYRFSVIK